MSDSIFEVEYRPGEAIVLRFRSPRSWGLSEPTRKHLLAAKKETLLAVRTILDKVIEQTEQPPKEPRKKRTKIRVQ